MPKLAFKFFEMDLRTRFVSFSGVIFADGQLWREHRKFMTKTLREMGVGKKNMDHQIVQEIQILSNHLKELCDKVCVPFLGP